MDLSEGIELVPQLPRTCQGLAGQVLLREQARALLVDALELEHLQALVAQQRVRHLATPSRTDMFRQ